MEPKQKILISAYACEPNLGSEIGVGWHWVLEMSKYFNLWVLTRESNRESIEAWFAENSEENSLGSSIGNKPIFIYYDLPKKYRFWKSGLRGVRLYYLLWQKFSNGLVKEVMQKNNIKIYHHLTYGNALWGVSSYGRKQTFIWGPTSAGAYIPMNYASHYGFKNKFKELIQRVMSASLSCNYGFLKRCKDANLILCKTEQTRLSVPEKYRSKAVIITDVAVELIDTSKYNAINNCSITRFLAVGRLESWRGFDLLIEAFAIALKQNESIHLDILGKGSDYKRLKDLIDKLNLNEKVSLRGQVSMDEYYKYMANCNVVVNPTLKEGAVTTAFDSLSFVKPLICINTGGYTRYFNNSYSIVLQLKERNETINELADSIIKLTDKLLVNKFKQNILKVRDSFVWARKGEEVRDLILKNINE